MSVAYSGDTRFILAAHTNRTIKVFDVVSGRVKHTLSSHADQVLQVITDDQSEKLAVSCGKDRKVSCWGIMYYNNILNLAIAAAGDIWW